MLPDSAQLECKMVGDPIPNCEHRFAHARLSRNEISFVYITPRGRGREGVTKEFLYEQQS
jgi:hypothetical protein